MKITLCNLSKKWTKKLKTNLEYLRKYQEITLRPIRPLPISHTDSKVLSGAVL